jgi:ribulose-phosphate 3-epimerase
MSDVLIAPSILSADFGHLARDVALAEASGADWIHVDVMDGHFVPNITIGPDVTRAVHGTTSLPLDVHLMIEAPDRLIATFVAAGASRITVHQEACPHLHRTLSHIRDAGAAAGVALNPGTPVETLVDVLPYLDQILIMTVNPGFGGQAFIPTSPGKIARARIILEDAGRAEDVLLEVDGGIDPETASEVVLAGARVLVAGSSVFGAEGGPAEAVPALRRASERALAASMRG